MKLVLKFLQSCVESRNKFEFFISFVKMAILYSKQKKHLKKSNFRIIFSDRFWLSFIALDVPISIFWVNSIQNQAKELTLFYSGFLFKALP